VRNADGSVTLSFLGTANSTNIVQATINVAEPSAWHNVSTNAADAGGSWQFTDTSASPFPGQFYRSDSPCTNTDLNEKEYVAPRNGMARTMGYGCECLLRSTKNRRGGRPLGRHLGLRAAVDRTWKFTARAAGQQHAPPICPRNHRRKTSASAVL